MTVRPISGKGVNRAAAVCDGCGREEVVAADYMGRPGQKTEVNTGQVLRKMCGHGWAVVKGDLLCPACEAARKVAKAKPAEEKMVDRAEGGSVVQLREPTRAMRIDILVALATAYDLDAQRYRGDTTDRAVAEAVGGGCMPGWVSALREAEFGPAGNEEVETIRAEIRRVEGVLGQATRDIDARIASALKIKTAFETELKAELAALTRRVDACVKAHDKRMGSR